MIDRYSHKLAAKHGAGAVPDPRIHAAIARHTAKAELPCAVAFKIAQNLKVEPQAVGQTADLMEYRLVKCQLGLFGYQPHKKIIAPEKPIAPTVRTAINARTVDQRLSCRAVWEIAADCGVARLVVSSACEAMEIKIKPCQLGAF